MGRLFAKFYDRAVRKSEAAGVGAWRRELLRHARGTVLEIGAGTGLNLPLYPAAVDKLKLSEPDKHMRRQLGRRAEEIGREQVELVDAGAEELPLEDGAVDTVVCTLVLCSVDDPRRSIDEIKRVLRPGGALLFIEHVAHEDPAKFKWQRRLEPFQRCFAAGCRVTRRTGQMIEEAGFAFEDLERDDMPCVPFWVRPSIRGLARR